MSKFITFRTILPLDESIRGESVIKAVNDQLADIGNMFHQLTNHVQSLAQKGHENKVIKMQVASRLARWYMNNFKYLEPDLRNLENSEVNRLLGNIEHQGIRSNRTTGKGPSNQFITLIDSLATVLPSVNPAFRESAVAMRRSLARLSNAIVDVTGVDLKSLEKDDTEEYGPSDQDIDDQNRQANQIVAQTLRGLPPDVASEIESRLPKSGNRLQALARELKAAGISR